VLLIVGHAAPPPWAGNHAHHEFPDAADVARSIGLTEEEWSIEVCGARERDTISPSGDPATISDSIIKAHRLVRSRGESS
jgi:hypothetical protein